MQLVPLHWVRTSSKALSMTTRKQVSEALRYQDGVLYWNTPRKNVRVGTPAGSIDAKGYVRITLNQKSHYAHRLIYLLHHGALPKFIDHVDGDPRNNRVENLRPCTPAQNSQNRKLQANNTSGVKGVYWNESKQRWMARVMVARHRKFLGYFDDLALAQHAVQAARVAAHRQFSRHN